MRLPATTIAILLLAACSGGGNDNDQAPANAADANAAGGESAGAAAGGSAASVSLQPGEWETIVQVTSMNVPNMPQGMTPPTPPPTTVRTCLTPEQARQPNASFLTGKDPNSGCAYDNFSMAGGRMQGTVSCNRQDTTMRSTFSGQFTPTSYEVTTEVETSARGMNMTMATRTTARRVGDCPAG